MMYEKVERGDKPMRQASGNPVRVGVLGCSEIARRKFIPALLATEHAILKGVGSRDHGKAARFCPGIAYAPMEYDELLRATDVDLIYLSVPNHLHEEWTLRALEQGKHVICEKPLGLNPRSVERMTAAADEKGVLLYENIMYLHHPQHRLARDLVRAGTIGRIKMLRSVFTFRLEREDDFRLDPAQGGGAFFDLARYPLSTALFHLQGEIGEFRGVSRERDGLDLALAGCARTDEDEFLDFSLGFDQPYESFYEIVGETGSIRIDRAYTTPASLANRVRVTAGGKDESFIVPSSDHFQLMLEHVCDLINLGVDFRSEHARSMRLARLAEKMRQGCMTEMKTGGMAR